jgi:hypothetical protein
MIDHDAVHQALRAFALPTTMATTGDVVLASTADGFTRMDGGSFVADRFAIGMEIVSSGFPAANLRAIVTSVAPTDLRVNPFVVTVSGTTQQVTHPAIPVDAAGGPRRIDAVLPSMRAWENLAPPGLSVFVPVAGIPYLEDEYSPSTSTIITQSLSESRGDYILRIHGVVGAGSSGLRRTVDALKLRFAPNTILVAADHGVRIDYDPMPESSAITATQSGPIITLTIPWIVRSRFSVLV